MAFITLEDQSGEIECVVFPKVYEKVSYMLRVDNCVILNGSTSSRDEEIKILASGLSELVENAKYQPQAKKESQAPKPQKSSNPNRVPKLFLRLPSLDCEQANKAKNLLAIFEGNVDVMLYDCQTKKYTRLPYRAEVSNFIIAELKALLGEENVVFG